MTVYFLAVLAAIGISSSIPDAHHRSGSAQCYSGVATCGQLLISRITGHVVFA